MEQWAEFKIRKKSGSKILKALNVGHDKLVLENRHYIKALIECLIYTCCQNIAQRGHDESENSENKGNFIELLAVVGKFDVIVDKKLQSISGNAKYTSPEIQNEIIQLIAKSIRNEINAEIADGEYFSLLVDETKDLSKREQIFVVLRYVYSGNIYESFLGFTAADGLNAVSLYKKIKLALSENNIDKNNCIAQCYDGAAVMSGCRNGVQQLFKQDVPQAIYIHCFAHRLNLALVDCVHNVQVVAEFFAVIQKLYNFFFQALCHTIYSLQISG